MANESIQNPHAKHEGDLADLIAQETLLDLYGGEEKTYNVPGLIVGLVVAALAFGALLLVAAGILYLIGA